MMKRKRKRKTESVSQNIVYKGGDITSLFRPSYDETTLFLMALAMIILLISYGDELEVVFGAVLSLGTFSLIFLMAVAGFGLSLFHAFSSRKKTVIEKTLMAVFALFVNGVTGIVVGADMLRDSINGWVVFPIMNIVSGLFLIYQIGFNPEKLVVDKDADTADILIGGLVLIVIFVLCATYFRLGWALTFSACVAYATLIHQAFAKFMEFIRKG